MDSNRGPLSLAIIATILAWGAWVFVVGRTDPDAVGALGLFVFYLALFTAVAGSATIIGLFTRRHASDRARAISIAIRQGALTALAVIVAVFLQSRDLLTWLNLIFLIAALTLLELFWISLQGRSANSTHDRELAA
ncbi:MAG: hypothetical protein Q8R16_04190, partial [bacterium]|nr:hypothetical protein [bacterium]